MGGALALPSRVPASGTAVEGPFAGLYRAHDWIAPKPALRPCFQRHYTAADVELLASVDEAHERLSGPATRHILKREFR
jgi:hypothetical protein